MRCTFGRLGAVRKRLELTRAEIAGLREDIDKWERCKSERNAGVRTHRISESLIENWFCGAHVLSSARVRHNWFSGSPSMAGHYQKAARRDNRRFWPLLAVYGWGASA